MPKKRLKRKNAFFAKRIKRNDKSISASMQNSCFSMGLFGGEKRRKIFLQAIAKKACILENNH